MNNLLLFAFSSSSSHFLVFDRLVMSAASASAALTSDQSKRSFVLIRSTNTVIFLDHITYVHFDGRLTIVTFGESTVSVEGRDAYDTIVALIPNKITLLSDTPRTLAMNHVKHVTFDLKTNETVITFTVHQLRTPGRAVYDGILEHLHRDQKQ